MSDTVFAALIGGIAGSAVTSIFGFVAILLQRRAEERRQIRELAVKVALENWKIYKEASERLGGDMQPIDVYLMHAVHMVSALDGRLKTPEQIREHLRQSLAASRAATTEIDAHNKKIQDERRKAAA
jgi:hypothetical protein